jgi:RNA 2',3'-cyclic 3'-phosphodiesterase
VRDLMQTNTHYFWAIRLSNDVKKIIFMEIDKIKPTFPFKRWVHELDYHITLTFLGSAEKEKLEVATKLVGDVVKGVKSFPLHLKGINVFGNREAPRIFWASVQKENQLFELQKRVYEVCSEVGFTLESRPYSPHITLARNWNGEAMFESEWLENLNPFKNIPISFIVDEVVLYKTNIEKTPKYEAIATFKLLVE